VRWFLVVAALTAMFAPNSAARAAGRAFVPGRAGCWSSDSSGCRRPPLGLDLNGVAFDTTDGAAFAIAANESIDYAVIAAATARSGALRLPARADCLAAVRARRCRALRAGSGDTPGFPADAVALNGRNVYVAVGDAGIVALDRPGSGRLRQLPGPAGCAARLPGPAGCTRVRGMPRATILKASSDGRNLYVVTLVDEAANIATLSRDPATGAISQPPGPAGCVSVNLTSCSRPGDINAPQDLELDPGGKAAYLTTSSTFDPFESEGINPARGTVTVLARNGRTGTLTKRPSRDSCLSAERRRSCRQDLRLGNPGPLAVSPDGRHLYLVSRGRDGDGPLVLAAGHRPHILGTRPPWPGPEPPEDIAVSTDGAYVDAAGGDTVATYKRDFHTGALRLIGCTGRGHNCRPDPRHRLEGGFALFPAPDGGLHVFGDAGLIALRPVGG
jgi:hypothetical protein